ncbi:MAG: hypothetical protein IT270_09495 [Saprospiraceae bacterium]|nr:hypothetical protein [Saprospiraceae bacterium]
MTFLIILIGIWTYPIISFILLWLTKNQLELRRQLIITSCILTALAFFGLATNISTTLSELDWLIVSSIYLTISLALTWTQFQKNKILEFFGFIAIILVFGVGYILGTIGLGFAVAEYDTDYEAWLGGGIIYKESNLGNAVSDHRGKKVEIYKTIPWFPLVEWRTEVKEYNHFITIMTTPLTIDYKPEDNVIYLSDSMWWDHDQKYIYWADSLTIE